MSHVAWIGQSHLPLGFENANENERSIYMAYDTIFSMIHHSLTVHWDFRFQIQLLFYIYCIYYIHMIFIMCAESESESVLSFIIYHILYHKRSGKERKHIYWTWAWKEKKKTGWTSSSSSPIIWYLLAPCTR